MEETYLLNVEGVKKKILHGGYGKLPDFQEGSKITFHFQTLKDDFERTVIDDSRNTGVPMEIIVGKMFKIEIWETLLTSMRINEVAQFWCDAVHTGMYALVSKGLRKIAEGKDPLQGQKHQCGIGNMFDYHSTGYEDLDELQRTPQPLIFIMELFKVEDPSSYKRDTWAMNNEEKLAAVPKLHTEGNRLVLSRKFKEASEKYQEAIICLRNLQVKEKPWEEGWLKLENLITPLVLNYCQCQLELGEYYEVLEHTTAILQKNNENVKAFFKRAKAHAAVWNEKEARGDFLRVAQLDPSLTAAVRKELKVLGERMRWKHMEDRKRYRDLFQQPLSKGESEESSVEKQEQAGNGLTAEQEQNNPEVLKHKRGLGAKKRETDQGNVVEEVKGLLVKVGERERDFVSQKKIEETVTAKRIGIQGEQRERQLLPDSGNCMVESSENEQQLGLGLQEPKLEVEAAEMNSEAWDQNGERDFATLTGKQDLRVTHISLDQMTVKPMNDTEEGSTEGHCETEASTGLEIFTRKGQYEGRCENGETEAHYLHRKQTNVSFGSEHGKEGMRAKSFEEEDCSQVQQEKSKRGMEVSNELDLLEETALRKEKGDIGDNSKPEKKLCGYEASPSCYEANPEGRVPVIEDCGKGIITHNVKVETSLREVRDNHKEKVGSDKEGINTEDTSTTQEKIEWDELGLKYFEAELIPSTEAENSKIGPQGTTSDTKQVDLQVTWEDPEKRGGTEQIWGEEPFGGLKMSEMEHRNMHDVALSMSCAEEKRHMFCSGEMAGLEIAGWWDISVPGQTALKQEETGFQERKWSESDGLREPVTQAFGPGQSEDLITFAEEASSTS
ncbi:uncharacterized protein PHA67_003873 [Liasis olivaceus]